MNNKRKPMRIHHTGYINVYRPKHPNCNKYGYVPEHRLIMERNIGRYLTNKEHVHHINGIRDDNWILNLRLFSHSEHISFENRTLLTGWNRFGICKMCGTTVNPHYAKGHCTDCYEKFRYRRRMYGIN